MTPNPILSGVLELGHDLITPCQSHVKTTCRFFAEKSGSIKRFQVLQKTFGMWGCYECCHLKSAWISNSLIHDAVHYLYLVGTAYDLRFEHDFEMDSLPIAC